MSRYERIHLWLRLTHLLPPEERGYVPQLDGDELPPRLDPAYERQRATRRAEREKREKERIEEPPFPPTWAVSDPSFEHNNDPGFDNAIRAYEEDR
jgi:hypothetical protein